MSLADKKVISIGTVSRLSGLSVRQIRYYEERKLIFPERTDGGTRLYSFRDVERLVEISAQMEEGLHTYDIHRLEKKREKLQLGAALGGGHSQRRIGRGSLFSGFVAWIPLTSLCYLSFNVLN